MKILDKFGQLAGEIIVGLLIIYVIGQVVYGGSWL